MHSYLATLTVCEKCVSLAWVAARLLIFRADIHTVPPVALRSRAILVDVQPSVHLLLVKSLAACGAPKDMNRPLHSAPRRPAHPWHRGHSGHGRRWSHIQGAQHTQFHPITLTHHR